MTPKSIWLILFSLTCCLYGSIYYGYLISCFQRFPGCLTTSPSQLTDFLVSLMYGFNKSYLCLISSSRKASGCNYVTFCKRGKIPNSFPPIWTPAIHLSPGFKTILQFLVVVISKKIEWSVTTKNKYQVTSYLNDNSVWSIMAFGCLENLSSQLVKWISKANQFSTTLELTRIAPTHYCIQPVSQVRG